MAGNSESRFIVCEDASQVAKIVAVRDQLPKLEAIISIEPGPTARSRSPSCASAAAARDAAEVAARVAGVKPEDPYTIIYTSGTTGPPKGCVLTHGNYRPVTRMCEEIDVIEAGEPRLPLPPARALLRAADPAAVRGPRRAADLLERRPAADRAGPDGDQAGLPAVSVPRIFEKIYTLVTSNNDPEKIAGATQLGLKVRRMQEAGQEVPAELQPRSTRPTPSCSSTSATSSAAT